MPKDRTWHQSSLDANSLEERPQGIFARKFVIKIYQNDKNGRSWTFRSGRLLNHFPRKGAVWSTFLRGRLGCQPGIQTTERCRPKRTRSPPSWRMPQWTHISQRYLDIRKGRESASEILPDNACSLYNRYIPTHIHSH